MELKQRVNSSGKLLLLVLIEWSGGEGYGGDRSRVCEGCRRQISVESTPILSESNYAILGCGHPVIFYGHLLGV